MKYIQPKNLIAPALIFATITGGGLYLHTPGEAGAEPEGQDFSEIYRTVTACGKETPESRIRIVREAGKPRSYPGDAPASEFGNKTLKYAVKPPCP